MPRLYRPLPSADRSGVPIAPPPGAAAAAPHPGGLLSRLAPVLIGTSLLVMTGASLIRNAWFFPYLPMPAHGPPWVIAGTGIPRVVVAPLLWAAAALGGAGVAAGLAAARRGQRVSLRLLLAMAVTAIAALTVLPPVGSTDVLDYASYGRIAVLGHSPYTFTVFRLRAIDPYFARAVTRIWQHDPSVYGPLATAEQYLAARLGGASAAAVTWWLKLWNTLAFGAVAVTADRLLRSDPARRLRAHLLWTANPLLLWSLIGAGHLDVLAAGAGLLGLLLIRWPRDAARIALARAAAAGALIGLATDIKINYLLFGLGLAWALRRSRPALLAASAAALAVVVAGYSWYGAPAIGAILERRAADNFYHFVLYLPRHSDHLVTLVAVLLTASMAAALLRRLPPGDPEWPEIRPVVALSAAWLFLWPYQLPWYDTMLVGLLLFYPATRIDWLVLARLTAGTVSNIPGNPIFPASPLSGTDQIFVVHLTPLVLLLAAVALGWMALSGRWGTGGPKLVTLPPHLSRGPDLPPEPAPLRTAG